MVDILSRITGFVSNEFAQATSSGPSYQPSFGLMFILIFVVIVLIVFLAAYIYTSLAYFRIAKKTRTEPAWLAWIPIANVYLMSKMAKMHWWPMLFMIPFYIFFALFFVFLVKQMFLIALLSLFLSLIPSLVIMIYWYIWHWKIFERLSRPGWWILLMLVPYAGGVLYVIFLGMVAWGKDSVFIEDKNIKKK